ncbi:GspE/PulE family protein [Endothiovibrio diazotrophicus]
MAATETETETAPTPLFTQTPEALVQSWGWPEPPESLLAIARDALSIRGLRSGEAAVHLGLCDEVTKERLLREKPTHLRTLAWLAERLPAVREGMQRLLALHRRLPYLTGTVEGLYRHPLMEEPAVARRCDELDAVLLQIGEGAALLVFAEIERLEGFQQLGRLARRRDPLRSALAGRHEALHWAVGARPWITVTRQAGDEAEGTTTGDGVMQARIWRAAEATGDAQRLLSRLLDAALALGADDLDIWPLADGSAEVRCRIAGLLRPLEAVPRLSAERYDEIRGFLLARAGANARGGRLLQPADGEIYYQGLSSETHIRGSFLPRSLPGDARELISASLRLVPRRTRGREAHRLAGLHLPAEAEAALRHLVGHQRDGIVCVVGGTNSGKSTTLRTLLGELDAHHGGTRKIIALEDPVEEVLPGIRQFSVPAHLGAEAYPIGLRALMRHDPDIIGIGEVRDRITAETAGHAAITGHLVATTLHANDTVDGAQRLMLMVTPEQRFPLANALRLLVAQRLVPRLCPDCRTLRPLTEADRSDWESTAEERGVDPASVTLPAQVGVAGAGCAACIHGYTGRAALAEVLRVTPAVRRLLLSDDPVERLALGELRSLNLFESAFALIAEGVIAWEALWA